MIVCVQSGKCARAPAGDQLKPAFPAPDVHLTTMHLLAFQQHDESHKAERYNRAAAEKDQRTLHHISVRRQVAQLDWNNRLDPFVVSGSRSFISKMQILFVCRHCLPGVQQPNRLRIILIYIVWPFAKSASRSWFDGYYGGYPCCFVSLSHLFFLSCSALSIRGPICSSILICGTAFNVGSMMQAFFLMPRSATDSEPLLKVCWPDASLCLVSAVHYLCQTLPLQVDAQPTVSTQQCTHVYTFEV